MTNLKHERFALWGQRTQPQCDMQSAATDGHINTALGFFVSHREGPGHGKMRERAR